MTPWSVAHEAPLPMGILRQEHWSWLPCPPPEDLPNPVIEPRFPTLQADSLPSEPQGKPKNTGVGSLFLLQGNFSTQESNQGLLHCRQILYQLSYQGSPDSCTQYASKFGKLSSGHRTGKGQFSSQRKAMPKNVQTIAQLHSSHTLTK